VNEVTLNPLECALNEAQVLRKQVDALQAENAKLREELAIRKVSEQEKVIECLRQENIDWEDKYRALASKNAKLRELCKDMMAFVEDDDACEHCRHDAECVEAADGELVLPYESRCLMLGLFADRMRELSVEADA